ncbi:dihydrodipicolinate synthase family protein [Spirillospora sp. CA-108201]
MSSSVPRRYSAPASSCCRGPRRRRRRRPGDHPCYARPTQRALYDWYATVAREFPDLPLVIYNVPSRTAVDIAPETVRRLFADFGNVVGLKETTRDFEHFSRVLHACGPELLVWSGIELLCLPLARPRRRWVRAVRRGPARGAVRGRPVEREGSSRLRRRRE